MIEILIALVSLTGFSVWGSRATTFLGTLFEELIAPVFAMIGFAGLLLYAFLAYDFFASGYKAEIINREYGTNYTQKEIFYASDVIEMVREIKRKRIELNGDLFAGE